MRHNEPFIPFTTTPLVDQSEGRRESGGVVGLMAVGSVVVGLVIVGLVAT
jgi:hypothetical protein